MMTLNGKIFTTITILCTLVMTLFAILSYFKSDDTIYSDSVSNTIYIELSPVSPFVSTSPSNQVALFEPEKVRPSLEKAEQIVQEMKNVLGLSIECRERVEGQNVIVECKGTGLYGEGLYTLEDSPAGRLVAETLVSINNTLLPFQNDDFKITVATESSADAIPLIKRIQYMGPPCECQSKTGFRSLVPGQQLDNPGLACARTAVFMDYLEKHGVRADSQHIFSKTFTAPNEKGAEFRFIKIKVTFHNIFSLIPKTDRSNTLFIKN